MTFFFLPSFEVNFELTLSLPLLSGRSFIQNTTQHALETMPRIGNGLIDVEKLTPEQHRVYNAYVSISRSCYRAPVPSLFGFHQATTSLLENSVFSFIYSKLRF